ncbi:MAG: hypothetical protein A2Z96_07770, partial [Spirochaetes bacterium GWB1_48_6]
MFGFLIKKAFFDMWDNLFRVVLLNLGFIACLFGLAILGSAYINPEVPALAFLTLCPILIPVFIYAGAASWVARDISDYQTPGFREFWAYLKKTAVQSLLFSLIVSLELFIIRVAIPFYAGLQSIIGIVAAAFILWIALFWSIACVYFFPVQSRLNTTLRKTVRKMLLIFFDNTVFSIGLALGAVVVLVLSGFTAFLLPGIATILVWLNAALKLRLYKYDYLEQHPEANRRKIPWD